MELLQHIVFPEHLIRNPFPEAYWDASMKPVVVLDGHPYSINDLSSPIRGNIAYVVGVNQKSFERLLEYVQAPSFHFYEMRVADISKLAECKDVRELAIHWNSKISDIDPVSCLKSLSALIFEDTPKLYDLSRITECKELKYFEFSGGIITKNKVGNLAPLSALESLRYLRLLNLKVDEGGLKPLGGLVDLVELEVSNQFKTEDYAYLSICLPNTSCSHFAPYVFLPNPLNDKNVMVVGARKPFLNPEIDSDKLKKYKNEFLNFQEKFAANKRMQ